MKKFLTLFFLFFYISLSQADIYVPISSDIYSGLRRLEALGYVKSGQLTTLPLSINEVKRLLKEAENLGGKDKLALKIIEKIKKELPKTDFGATASIEYKYTEQSSILQNKNNFDLDIEKGSNLIAQTDIFGNYTNFGAYVSPYFISNERYEKVSLNEIYGLFTYKKLEVSIGKENQWWGGGQNGSILLSNNPEGLNVIKISNSTPYEFIVPFRFTFFLTKLENNRTDVKSPYMNGLRLTLKPSEYLEIGLSKTAIYGGKGRDNSLSAFFDSLIGNREKNTTSNINNEPGDQRAGFDFKIISPNKFQPFTFYLEAIGEDVSEDFPYPYKYAFIYSLYLPKVLSFNNLELLVEHADTVFRQDVWYKHHIFTQGYTYNGDIIGHYMGGNAKDWFVMMRYNSDKSNVELSYERLKKVSTSKIFEAYEVKFIHNLSDFLSLLIESGYFKEDKEGFVAGTGIKYKF